ncbi:hypothetical protein GQ55_6G164200 [Panicum hallii var. hallii]|uniref:Uncharacterized protein n=1 Tax=Panicum hallii var. hallii TaxID=1504633 RepID=A0A2T7D6K6_9POAL|nr:hypothetical protein GQ55_6G164200 [Panicum hallii var. hallii]
MLAEFVPIGGYIEFLLYLDFILHLHHVILCFLCFLLDQNGVSFVLDSIARFGSCRGSAPCCVPMIPAPTPCCAEAPPCSWPQALAAFSTMDEDPAILSDGIRQRLATSWIEPSRAGFCAR